MTSEHTIAVIIGRDEHGTDVAVDLAGGAHFVIAGETRSGKSSALYTLLAGLAGNTSVRVTGIDPTQVVLNPWPTDELRVLGFSGDKVKRFCDRLLAILDERHQHLCDSGVDELTSFTPTVPLIIVVLEEYGALTRLAAAEDTRSGAKPVERLAPYLASTVTTLVAAGAKAGIRVFLSTQRADANVVGGEARSNFTARVCLRVSDAESLPMRMPGIERNDPLAVRLRDNAAPGCGLIRLPGRSPRWFRCDHTTYREYRAYVAQETR